MIEFVVNFELNEKTVEQESEISKSVWIWKSWALVTAL